jgi:hypothetical protein
MLFLLVLFSLQLPATVRSQSETVTAQLREAAIPIRITGKITGAKDVSGLPITLHNPTGSPLQTRATADGSFEFTGVSRGSYTLQAPGFVPIDFDVHGTSLDIDLKPLYSGSGVSVSGKVSDKSVTARTTRTVTLAPLLSGPSVTGGVTALEGSVGASLQGTLEAWVRPDGKFEFPAVPPGSYMLRSLPAAPATSRRLDIGGTAIRDLEIVIPYQIEVVGRVLLEGRDPGPFATVEATQPTFTAATGIQSDGRFRLRLTEGENRISMTRLPPEFSVKMITFGGVDITRKPLTVDSTMLPQEIVITLETLPLSPRLESAHRQFHGPESPVPSATQVAGRVRVVDAEGKPYPFRPAIGMVFRHSNAGVSSTSVAADGTFAIPLAANEYFTMVANLPEGYSIKSIASGTIDLLESPLKVDGSKAPDNIDVVLEYKPAKR